MIIIIAAIIFNNNYNNDNNKSNNINNVGDKEEKMHHHRYRRVQTVVDKVKKRKIMTLKWEVHKLWSMKSVDVNCIDVGAPGTIITELPKWQQNIGGQCQDLGTYGRLHTLKLLVHSQE